MPPVFQVSVAFWPCQLAYLDTVPRVLALGMAAFRTLPAERQAELLQHRSDSVRLKKQIADITATIKENPLAVDVIVRQLAKHNIQLVDSKKGKLALTEGD